MHACCFVSHYNRLTILSTVISYVGLIGVSDGFAGFAYLSMCNAMDFRKNVIEPNLGECSVGYVMAANYTASAIVSISIGRVSDLLGRPFVMGFAGSCLCCMFVVLKYFPPTTFFAM